jgi:hypothetical protein
MKQYKFSKKFYGMSEDDIEDDVERFYIDLVERLGEDEVADMLQEDIHLLFFSQYLESEDDSFDENLN